MRWCFQAGSVGNQKHDYILFCPTDKTADKTADSAYLLGMLSKFYALFGP